MNARRRIATAAAAYFALVFLFGFAFGIVRTLLITPRIGALAAVAIEVPLLLAVSIFAAGALMRRFRIQRPGEAVAMGAIAFCLLIPVEFAFAALLGTPPAIYLASLATAPGALGLLGQVLFALVPAARSHRTTPQ